MSTDVAAIPNVAVEPQQPRRDLRRRFWRHGGFRQSRNRPTGRGPAGPSELAMVRMVVSWMAERLISR